MEGRRLVGAIRTAHLDVGSQFARVEHSPPSRRAASLAELERMMTALRTAEEATLFPALGEAMGADAVLAESLRTDHRELADRLQALTRGPHRPGFERALDALAQDVRDHQQDEIDTVIPVLIEALGEDGAAEVAADFVRALGRPL